MALLLTETMLSEMQSVDPLTVDRSTLVDIKDVLINPDLPKLDRMKSFVEQIKNPYCYKCGKIVVKLRFSEKDATLEERLMNHFRSLV